MPIFSKGVTKDKLTILYFANVCNMDLTRDQIHRAMVENDCMSYFDFQTAMHELEEDGYLAAIPRSFGQGYRVSVRGTDALSMFGESLQASVRARLDAYAANTREAMRIETQLTTSMEELPSGGYMVRLKAQEQTSVLLDVSVLVASRSMAQRIRANWVAESDGVYQYLLTHLLKQNDAAGDGEED